MNVPVAHGTNTIMMVEITLTGLFKEVIVKDEIINLRKGLFTKLNQILGDQEPLVQVFIILAAAGLAILISVYLARFVSRQKSFFYRFTRTELLADLIAQTTSLIIRVAGLIVTLYIIGAESIIGFVLGTAGIIGLGISFAFKDIIENYIAGVLLSIRQPFLKSHHIKVEGHEGVVQRMTTRMTMIKSFDGNNISIPNATIFKSTIINYSIIPERRFSFKLGINPDADANFARKVGLKVLADMDGILQNPPPLALIDSIGDSSIVLDFFGWVDQDENDFFQMRSLAISAVKEKIEEVGIEIPDPSYIIKIKHPEERVSKKAGPEKKQETTGEVEHLISPHNKQKEVISKQIQAEGLGVGNLDNDQIE